VGQKPEGNPASFMSVRRTTTTAATP
jgi:hypothetical protein